jgi:hypothetical protein
MSPTKLTKMLAVEGAKLLTNVIQQGLFIPPVTPIKLSEDNLNAITDGKGFAKATKLSKADMKIEWNKMSSADILRRHRVLGSLWDDSFFDELGPSRQGTRVIFEQLGEVVAETISCERFADQPPGFAFLITGSPSDRVVIKAMGNSFVEVLDCTIAGESRGTGRGLRVIRRLLEMHNRH